MFRLGRVASASIRASVVRPAARQTMATRNHHSVFAWDNLKNLLPEVPKSTEATLGSVWDGIYTNYRYKMIYPVLLWIAFLEYNLWTPYAKDSSKVVEREKEEHLKSLEYHQLLAQNDE
ncbi:hypothetical protein SmJEL517_g05101 [Synchytrium microbalum]|uniref:Uncharacterized protein n=1 Tax=Synchytrium microbalum TaxID=1806994 RepID=A0A507C0K8_9FUNG|nr:uncharacterized protein SmJEL517_g05101 [Synchytrium microbalum]TPX31604.1 hypothetical protein SmJEL517_g05101 [Synchytrium microbalum]